MDSLRISEIFLSLQGESESVGWPTVFVRLTGCPLRCVWCDSEYAFSGGLRMNLQDILDRVAAYAVPRVCVTGGEPLAQPAVHGLLDRLVAGGFNVSLETSGALDVAGVNPAVKKVIDLKPPGSGELAANRYENLDRLCAMDQVKFVLKDRTDYLWAVECLQKYALPARCQVLFSPVADHLPPVQLAEWILEDRLNVRFQLQLHKILWGDQRGV